jgi:hypothetical protein
MSTEAASTTDSTWIRTIEAREQLGLSSEQMGRLIRRGVVTVKSLPGLRPLVLRSDVERLASESIKPAKFGA